MRFGDGRCGCLCEDDEDREVRLEQAPPWIDD